MYHIRRAEPGDVETINTIFAEAIMNAQWLAPEFLKVKQLLFAATAKAMCWALFLFASQIPSSIICTLPSIVVVKAWGQPFSIHLKLGCACPGI
jgi:hypothetical protein